VKRRVEIVWWRIGKFWKTHRARAYREELVFRLSKNIPVSDEQWRRSDELLREARDY
jgi:hypothetical protein